MLVDLYDVGACEYVALVLPVYGVHVLAAHLAQVALRVDGYAALGREVLHHLGREVVGEQ